MIYMKKKIFAVLLLSVFVFGVPGRANAQSYLLSGVKVIAESCAISSTIGGAVVGVMFGTVKGASVLAKKVFSHSGPKCPLLPFVRR